jgi:predicted nucleic-acid-binding protein
MQKFHKYLKLTNGDDIIATTDSNCENFKQEKVIYVYDPVQINTIRIAQENYFIESFTMQPWIKLAKDDIMEIPTESIVVVVDIDDKVVTQYEMFLNEYNKSAPDFERTSEEELDNIFETLESEDDLDGIRENQEKEGPTFH